MTDEREPDHERERERVDTSHLEGVEDGCGCTEVWEHLSAGREVEEGASGTDAPADAEVAAEAEVEAEAPTVDAGET